MSRDLSPTTLENIEAPVVKPFFAVELNFSSDTIRMWTGQGTLVLDDGTQWFGLGQLLNISSIEETSEMAVKGATVSLSGIPSEILSLALSEPYQGRVCNIYFGTLSTGGVVLISLCRTVVRYLSRLERKALTSYSLVTWIK